MTTNVALITDSLRLLGVISEIETPSSEQGSHALGRMNRMIESWVENDINLGWFWQTSTTATAPLPLWAERGVISKLAQDLYATYPSGSLAPWVFDDNDNGFGIIRRKAQIEKNKPADMRQMPMGEGKFLRRSSILNDDQ